MNNHFIKLILPIFLALANVGWSQCTDWATYGNPIGGLMIDGNEAAYQTQLMDDQDYTTLNVTCGSSYHFTFCNNGGNTGGGIWPEINILNGTTLLAFGAYAGGCSEVTWVSTMTGTITIYIIDNWEGCTVNASWSGTMAYNEVVIGSNSSFTMNSTGCTTASATITGDTGGTFSFNPNPGDGAAIDANTGNITGGTGGSTYDIEYDLGCGNSTIESVTLDNSGDASFSLNPSCGGAVPIITGNQGGIFSWDPNPGDGAQVSTSTGVISNGTAGTSYSIEYTVCGTSNTETVTVVDDDCFTLNNDAQYITVNGEQCIQLTAAANAQTGCAWNTNQIDFNSDFSLNLDYYFGSSNGSGADGNTFTFQPSSSSACGVSGSQLGGGGIANSLVIEFDTYDNDGATNNDLSCDHIAIEVDGDLPDDPSYIPANTPPLEGPVCANSDGSNIDDGNVYAVEISWDATAQDLSVYFDGDLRLTLSGYDVVTNVFGGQNEVYWGATAATGGLNNQQYFCPSTVVILPAELTSFESICEGPREYVQWETDSEFELSHFVLEYTYNGLVFFPVDEITATGTTTMKQSYGLTVNLEDTKQRYYRLKVVDDNGETEYTELIASKSCQIDETGIIHSVKQIDNQLMVSLNDNAKLRLINSMGKTCFESNSSESSYTIPLDLISNGLYFIYVSNDKGEQDTWKSLVHY